MSFTSGQCLRKGCDKTEITRNIVRSIETVLRQDEDLFYNVIVTAYDSDTSAVPIDKGIISVGLDGMYVGEKTPDEPSNVNSSSEHRDYTARVIVKIHTPCEAGEAITYQLLDKVLSAVFKVEQSLGNTLSYISVKQPKYLRFTDSMRLDTILGLKGQLSCSEE